MCVFFRTVQRLAELKSFSSRNCSWFEWSWDTFHCTSQKPLKHRWWKKYQWRSEVGKSSNTCKFLLLSNMIIRSYCKLFHYLWTGRTKIRNYFTQPKQIRSTLFLRYMNEKHLIIQDFLLLFVYVLLPHRRQKEGTRISSLPQSGHVRQLKTNEISISTVHTRCKIRHSDLVSSFKYLNKVN